MAVLQIRLLGGFEARAGGGTPAEFPTKKTRALLAYLARRPGTAYSRDEIADLLWGSREDEQARGSLRRTLSDLRKAVPLADAGWLVSNGDALMVDADCVEVDAVDLERLAGTADPPDLERAADLYHGELLAGFGLHEQAFEDWLRNERQHMRGLALQCLGKLLIHKMNDNALDRAITVAGRLLALDPLDELAHRALMSVYARLGRRAEALRQYNACRTLLEGELGIEPDAATEALHRELQGSETGHFVTLVPPDLGPQHAIRPGLDKPGIAVLPLANLSGDPEQDYFADGLVEDIVTALSRVSAVWVVARASTAAYRGKQTDVKQIGRELGVRYVMEGSVRRAGDRLRVSVQLADAISGRQVWGEHYDRPIANQFDIQDEITRRITASLETQIMIAEGQAFTELRPGNARVRDLITRAAWSRVFDQTPEAIAEASDLTEQAIRIDPTYPQAHRMRAAVLFNRLWLGHVKHEPEILTQGMDYARTALRMAPRDELAHLAMAWAWAYSANRLEEAVAECDRGIEINPNCSLLHGNRGVFLAMLGRSQESIEASELALQLNPRDPSNFWRHYGLATAHFAAGNDAEALRLARRVALSRPQLQCAIIWAAAAGGLGDAHEARLALQNCIALRPDLTVGLVVPHLMLRFARDQDHERLLFTLRKAGVPS